MAASAKSTGVFIVWGLVAGVLFLASSVYLGFDPQQRLAHAPATYVFFASLLLILAFLGAYLSRGLNGRNVQTAMHLQLLMVAILLGCMTLQLILTPAGWLEALGMWIAHLLLFLIGMQVLQGLGLLFYKQHRKSGLQLVVVGMLTCWWFHLIDVHYLRRHEPPVALSSVLIDSTHVTQATSQPSTLPSADDGPSIGSQRGD